MGQGWRHWFRRGVRVPPVRQRQDSECAVAALAMILAYYGQPVPMERLRRETGVSRDGCTLATIAATARRQGFTVQSYSRDSAGLAPLGFPLLVQLDFNHAVVVEGIAGDRVRVCDPALGPLCLDRAEFDDRFTGIVQRIRPGPDLPPPVPPPPGWVAGLWHWLGPVHGWMALALLLTLAGWAALGWAMADAAPFWLLPGLSLLWLRLCTLRRAAARAASAARAILVSRLADQPAAFFTYRLPPLLAQQMHAPSRLAPRLAGVEGVAVLDGLGALLPLGLLCHQAPLAWGLAVAGFLGTLGLLAGVQVSRLAPGRVLRRFGRGAAMLPPEMLIQIAPLKLAGRLRQRLAVLAAGMAQRISARQRVAWRDVPLLLAPLVLLGSVQLLGGAAAVLLCMLPVLALLRLVQVAADLGDWADELAAIADLSAAPAVRWATPPATVQSDMVVTGLSFGHRPGVAPLFSGVDLVIPKAVQVGLTGGPGAGCSSLGRVLAGQMKPWEGRIDGPERRLIIDAASPFLAGSLRDNLTLWSADIPTGAVENALRLAEVWELVQARGGLDLLVEDGAPGFSGGERRRLILARALLHRPGLLVLDGLFDNLDLALERRIRANLAGAGVSLLVISRRSATLAGGGAAFMLTPTGLVPWQPAVADDDAPSAGQGQAVAPLPPLMPAPTEPAMAAALVRVARRLGRAIPADAGALDDMGRDAGLLLRRVRLTGPWRGQDGPALLMSLPDGGALALVAHRLGGYRQLAEDQRLGPLPADLPGEALAVLPLLELRGGAALLPWAVLRQGGAEGLAGFAAMAGAGILALVAPGVPAGPGLCLLAAAVLFFAWGWGLRDRAMARGLAGAHLALWYRLLRLPATFLHRQAATALEGRLDSLDDLLILGPTALSAVTLGLALLALGGLAVLWMLALLPPVAALGWLTAWAWMGLRGQMAGDQRFLAACLADFPALRQMGAGARLLVRWADRAEQGQARLLSLAQRRPLVWLAGLGLAGLAPPGMVVPLAGALLMMEAAWRLAMLGPAARAAAPLLAPEPEAGLADDRSLAPPRRVELANIHFRYPGTARPALSGVSLSLAGGQVVGLTGPSGGGKTTLLRLLLGLERPDQGQLRVDGAPCTPQRLFAMRRHMDVVEQDMRLPLATMRHHLTGDNPRPLAELEAALRLVGLWEMVAALPMGLQSLLSDAMLGAGEVQRLHIARCLLTRPRLLILDEATTALDITTEARVLAALREGGCACLLVTHRPESLALADRVLRLEDGRLLP
jgi:ABC-type bacteriocin/lantibiotic exporter with double-glycine peptidase domain